MEKNMAARSGNGNDLENLTVDEYTTPSPFFVSEKTSIGGVIKEMEERGIRHLPVLNEKGETTGVISDRDVAAVKAFDFNRDLVAKDIMTPDPVSVNKGASLLEASYQMAHRKIGSLIVNDDHGNIYGIFTSLDALNALIEILRGDVHGERDFIQDF